MSTEGFKSTDLIWKERREKNRLTTGSENFDDLIHGGFEAGTVNEIYGEYRTGKTQLVHQLSVNVQLPFEEGGLDGGALYIDTEDSFRPERISQMAEALNLDTNKVRQSLFLIRVYNTAHQIQAIKEATDIIEKHNIKLLIVDSVVNHFRNEYSEDFEGEEKNSSRKREGFKILNNHLHKIKRLVDVYNLVCVITNQVFCRRDVFVGNPVYHIGEHTVSHFATNRLYIRNYESPRSVEDYKKVARFIKDVRVKTKKSNGVVNKLIITDNLQKIVRVVDSPYLPESESTFFITPEGIRDRLQ